MVQQCMNTMEIQDSNNKNKLKDGGVIQRLIEAMIEIGETTKITQKNVQP